MNQKMALVISRIPVELILIGMAIFLYIDWTDFHNEPSSPLVQAQKELERTKRKMRFLERNSRKLANFGKALRSER